MKKHFSFSLVKILLILAILVQITELRSFIAPYVAVPIAEAAGATRTWDGGGGDNNASTAANWSSDTAPVAGDDVVFDSTSTKNCTWNISAGTTFASFSINTGYTGTISLSNSLTMTGAYTQAAGTLTFNAASVVVTAGADSTISGGTINHAQEPNGSGTTATRAVSFSITGSLNYSGGSISVNGLGFVAGQGPGAGYDSGFQGGSYGGDGGINTGYSTTLKPSGIGSIAAPVTAGSGGGGGGVGYGGGVVKFVVSGTFTVGGNITANGASATANYTGGGSGGSVWIDAGTLAGSGSITANGGNNNGVNATGAGGGGRVALTYTSRSHNGTVSAYGGTSSPNTSDMYGGAGTVYTKAASATYGDLVIDNNGNTTSQAQTRINANTTVANLTVKGAARTYVLTGNTLTVSTALTNGTSNATLTVNSGGILDISSATVSGAPNITVSGSVTTPSSMTWSQNTFTQGSAVTSLTSLTVSGGTYTQNGTLANLTALTVSGGTYNMGAALPTSGMAFTVSSGTFKFNSADTLTLTQSPTISGGTITQAQEPAGSSTTATRGVVIAVTGDLNIQGSATITSNSLGFPSVTSGAGSGPAPGGNSSNAPGGANGGDGGHGSGNSLGGASGIGSVSAPVTAGSSGASRDGSSPSGAGGGAVKLTATGTLTVAGTVTANGGSGTSNGGGGAGGSIWLSAGTFAGAGTITANGGNAGNTNGGGGGGGKIAFTYSSKSFNGTVTAYGGSDSAGNNDLRRGGAGTIYDNGALTIDNNSKASTRQTRTPAATVTNLTLANTAQLTLAGNMTASGNVTIGSGTTVTPSSYTLTVGGNFSNSGTFTAGTSTVVFDTAGTTSTLSGSTTFYNLSSTTAGKNITFTAGTTTTVSNTLTLTGSTGNMIILRSSSTGSYWNINPSGTRSVSFVNVKDSNNANGTAITASDSIDSGHNSNWSISSPPPNNPDLTNYNTGDYIATNTPALTFNLSDPNGLDVKYQLQIDDNSDFGSPVVDATEGSFAATPRTGVSYTPSALSDGAYYWRVRNINSASVYSSYVPANSGAVAFIVDTTGPTSPSISINSADSYAVSTSATLTLSATDAGSGVSEMMVSEDSGFSGASWESYAASKSFTLSGGDDTKTVYVKFRDALGNVSSTTSDTIVLDATAPSGSVSINAADAYTSSSDVTLTISASDATSGMYQMQVSEDSGFSGASWESYATSKSFTLSGLDGTHTVYIRFKDNAGNVSLATTDDIILDTAAPTGSISINAAATYTNTRSVTLTVSALDSTSGLSQMEVSESAVFSGASYESYATSKAFTLSATDGTHTVYIRFKDAAGNVSSTYSDTIVLDRSGPVVTAFSINSDATYATSGDVTLTIGAFDVTSSTDDMMISESNSFVGASWEPYATSKSFTLSDGDGIKTIYIKFRDSAGNSSLPTYDTITLDTTMPDGSVTINGGDGYTQLRDVTLELSSSDNLGSVSLMRVSEDISFDGVAWEAYATTKDYTLSTEDGTKTVFVEFQDDAGNISGTVSDSITYDATAPAANSVAINSDASTTATRDVTLTISSTDDTSGVVLMEISEDASFTDASWELYATSKSITLSAGDGTKTVYARFEDAAGNISTGVSDAIVLDTANPSGSIVVNDNDALTPVRTVTLTLSATDATTEVVEMQISESSGFVGASWEAYATTKSFTLSSGDGVKTVYARFKDEAGNISSTANDTIEFDSTAPGITSFVVNSNDTYANSRSVILAISASDSGGGIYQMMISNSADFSGGAWESYAATKAWTLPDVDGAQTVYIKFRDSILNVSDTASDSIILDQVLPTGTISINSGDAYTNSRIVTAALSASDATSGLFKMMLSDDATFTGASWEDYNTSRSYTLNATDGVKTLYVKFMDNAGNVSSVATDTIIQDTTGPVPTYVKINNDAQYTTSRSATVKVASTDATTSVVSMMVSLSNTFLLAEWQPYATELPLTLTAGDGTKTVYVKFKDAQGNISSTIQSSITLDMTAPAGTITMNAGAEKTTSRDVTLTLSASDATSGVATMRISEILTFSDVSSESYVASRPFTLSSAEGTKTVYVEYKDAAGNVSPVVFDVITYAAETGTETDTSSGGSSGSGSGSTEGSSGSSESGSGSGSGSENGSNGGNSGEGGPILETTSLTLRVLDKDNKPVPNAKVILPDGTVAFTDENGVVTFENVAQGETNVRIEYGDTVEEKRVTISSNQGEVAVNLSKNLGSGRPYAKALAGGAVVVMAGALFVGLRTRLRKRRMRGL